MSSVIANAAAPMTEREIRLFVDTLLKEKGESGASQMLQQRILRTKKIESECSALTKKAEAEKKQADSYREETGKLLTKARLLEAQCSVLSADAAEWPAKKERRVTEWAERMATVSGNLDTETKTLSAKMDAEELVAQAHEEENVTLKANFDAMRAEFDDAFKAYEVSWKEREEKTQATIRKLQDLHGANEETRARGALQDQHVQRLTESIKAYSEQLEMYEARFNEVESSTMRSEDIKELAERQEAQLKDQIQAVEVTKKGDVDEKLRYDTEAQKLRAKYQQVKKRVLQLEKTKNAAEAKCRDAQKKAKK